MQTAADKIFRFEGFTVDPRRGGLFEREREIALRPRSFAVLCYLVEHAGRLVANTEIMNALWRDVVVTDASLTQCVSEIRLALRDDNQQIIRTLPRRGYLFAASVSETDHGSAPGYRFAPESPPAPAPPRRSEAALPRRDETAADLAHVPLNLTYPRPSSPSSDLIRGLTRRSIIFEDLATQMD